MSRRIQTLPPIIVSSVVMTIFITVAVGTVSKSVEAAQATETTAERAVMIEIAEEPEESAENNMYSAEDRELLAKIAMAEAESESIEGKALVMLVALNRVRSEDFPDTIEGVIFQKNQFSPVREGGRFWTTQPDTECYEALELVMSGWDESEGALYFESCRNSSWHSRNLKFLYEEGNHRFYR